MYLFVIFIFLLLLCDIVLIIYILCFILVVKDFLRLAKDFMDKGPNSNLYDKAAGIIIIISYQKY